MLKKSSRILFVAPPFWGHTNQLVVLAQELAQRGHQVLFANATAFRERITRAGIEFLAWEPTELADDVLRARWEGIWETVSREPSIQAGEAKMWDVASDMFVPMYKTLAKIFDSARPDLVVADSAAVAAMDLAQQRQIPCVVIAQFLGNHAPLDSRYPRYGTPYSVHMNWRERFWNYLHPILGMIRFLPVFFKINRVRKVCAASVPWQDLYRKNLMLVCTAFGIEQPRPVPPNIQMVGPLLAKTPERLSPDLEQWFQAMPKDSTVVAISLGTLATIESWQVQALVEGLTDSRWRVLWAVGKNRARMLKNLPAQFRIESFIPQQAVLSHPAVKLFVSHCGMNSVSESLYWGKPILALPIFGDQHYNAARVVDAGAGLRLKKNSISADEVRKNVNDLLRDPTFTGNARRLSTILQHTGGRNRAADLVELALHKGAQFDPKSGASPSCRIG